MLIDFITFFLVTSSKLKSIVTEEEFNIISKEIMSYLEDKKIEQYNGIIIKSKKIFEEKLKLTIYDLDQTSDIIKYNLDDFLETLENNYSTKPYSGFENIEFRIILQNYLKFNFQAIPNKKIEKLESILWKKIIQDSEIAKLLGKMSKKNIKNNYSFYNTLLEGIYPDYIQNEMSKQPPFTISRLLELSWGLSLNFSHEESQRTLGQKFVDMFSDIWKRYRPEKLEPKNPVISQQSQNERFIENMIMSLTKTSRNLGFVRNSHVKFIESKDKELERKKKFYDDISDLTSFSKEGFLTKVATFVGSGSFIALLKPFIPGQKEKDPLNAEYDQLVKMVEIAPESKKEEAFEALQKHLGLENTITSDPSSLITETSVFFPADAIVGWFIIGGLISTVLLTLFLNRHKIKKLEELEKKINIEQRQYWRTKFKPESAEYVYYFYQNILRLLEKYYDKGVMEKMNEEFLREVNSAVLTKHPDGTCKIFKIDTEGIFKVPNVDEEGKKVIRFIERRILPDYDTTHPKFDPIYSNSNPPKVFVNLEIQKHTYEKFMEKIDVTNTPDEWLQLLLKNAYDELHPKKD